MSKNKKNTAVEQAEPGKLQLVKAEAGAGAVSLFGTAPDLGKLKRVGMPGLVKPDSVPVGGAVSGTILKICDPITTTVKGKLLWIRHDSGAEFLFPLTGAIRQALAPGAEGDKLEKALAQFVNRRIVVVRGPDRMSDKYKKSMFTFDVYIEE